MYTQRGILIQKPKNCHAKFVHFQIRALKPDVPVALQRSHAGTLLTEQTYLPQGLIGFG